MRKTKDSTSDAFKEWPQRPYIHNGKKAAQANIESNSSSDLFITITNVKTDKFFAIAVPVRISEKELQALM